MSKRPVGAIALVAASFLAGVVVPAAVSDDAAPTGPRHYTVVAGDTAWSVIVKKVCDGRTSSAAVNAFQWAATPGVKPPIVLYVGNIIHVDPANCPPPTGTTSTTSTTVAVATTTTSSAPTSTLPAPTTNPATTTPPDGITHGRDLTKAMVGPRVPAVQVFNTRQTITTPGVYTAVDYRGGVDVQAAGVTFIDCRFSSTDVAQSAVVFVRSPNVQILFSEVNGNSKVYVGIKGQNGADGLVVQRTWIHHVGHGLNTSAVSWRMTESWIDNIVAPNPAPYPGDDVWHADGILSWGSNTLAERNVIDLGTLPQTAAVNHGTWTGSGPVSNVRYVDNVLAGGGFTVYFEERGFALTGLVVTGNDMRPGPYGYIYPGARPQQTPTWANNRRPDGTTINW